MIQRPRRSCSAGSAYVEALVLLPLFVVILLCALALGRSYEARLLSGQRAREAAWRETGSGCDRPAGGTLERARALRFDTGDDAASGLTAAVYGAVTLERHSGEASVTALSRNATRSFRTVTQLACNEVPLAESELRSDSAPAWGLVEHLLSGARP